MSVWTTKALSTNKEYIVLKHRLKGVNYSVQGVKFRDGYAVVEKNSKTYFALLKMPILTGCQEFPLVYLRKLNFITRSSDVKTIYGQDVYRHYVEELTETVEQEAAEEKQQADEQHKQAGRCCYVAAKTGELCENEAYQASPSRYCKRHLLEDPKLKDYGIKVPGFITKQEKAELREKVIKQLSKIKEVPSHG